MGVKTVSHKLELSLSADVIHSFNHPQPVLVGTKKIPAQVKVKRRFRPGTVALRGIRRYQASSSTELLIRT
jgi:hypothetical protein